MEDRSTASKPVVASPSPSTTPDTKSPNARPLYSSKLGDQRPRAPAATASPPTPRGDTRPSSPTPNFFGKPFYIPTPANKDFFGGFSHLFNIPAPYATSPSLAASIARV